MFGLGIQLDGKKFNLFEILDRNDVKSQFTASLLLNIFTIASYQFECKQKRLEFRFKEEIHYTTDRMWDQCTTTAKGIWKRSSFYMHMYGLRIFQSRGEEEEKSTAAQPTYVHHHLKIRQFYISRCLDYGVSQSLRVYSYIQNAKYAKLAMHWISDT